jgi:hypothetical protein
LPKPAPAHPRPHLHLQHAHAYVRRCFPLQWQPARDGAARLFLDRRLTPLERNAWQVFRLMLNDDGVTAFPTYEQLRPWLASMPCAGQASHETVARALTLLRLTRWLSLVRRRRDPKTGRILGNLYVLHDEPLTVRGHAARPDYLQLVSQALGHSAKAVQIVACTPSRRSGRPDAVRTHPAVAAAGAGRTPRQPGHHGQRSYPQEDAIHDSEEGARAFFGMANAHFGIRSRAETRARRLSSESEAGPYST